jgi:hypothetical protein
MPRRQFEMSRVRLLRHEGHVAHAAVRALQWYLYIIILVWSPGQDKTIASLSFFHGCRKRRLKNYQHSQLGWTILR